MIKMLLQLQQLVTGYTVMIIDYTGTTIIIRSENEN